MKFPRSSGKIRGFGSVFSYIWNKKGEKWKVLKLAGLVGSGVDAKFVIQDGLVKVNGEVETQRGKKLYPGDTVSYDGKTFKVEN